MTHLSIYKIKKIKLFFSLYVPLIVFVFEAHCINPPSSDFI